MRLFKRNGVYHAEFRDSDGNKVQRTTRCSSLSEARKVVKESGLEKLEEAAKTARLTQETIARILSPVRLTTPDAIDQYLDWLTLNGDKPRTISNSRIELNAWSRHQKLDSRLISAVTDAHIRNYLNRQSKAKASTRQYQHSLLRQFFSFCSAKGWVVGNPARLVRKVNLDGLTHEQKESKPQLTFSEHEVITLYGEAESPFWKFAILAAWHLGLRLGDICQLEWDCFTKDTIAVHTDKRDVRVEHHLPKRIRLELAGLPVEHPAYLFPEQRQTILSPSKRSKLSVQFGRLCLKLGIKGKSFHALRHTYATRLKAHGEGTQQIAQALGHRNTCTTDLYIH